MSKIKSLEFFKFFMIYSLSLIAGNLIIYGIDRVGTLKGHEAMAPSDFLVFNVVIIGLSILLPALMENKKLDDLLDKILS
ncbi:hypothetical protein ACSAZK_11610 [Methanosarcina sp. Mfa9]|uniref:hypothetical protein n=1 Tax=Methanosarcina sp. Mfa9 TaxID=3439063 RepID=UPI003F828D8D